MGKRKIFTICFLVFVVGVIAIAMIITSCGKKEIKDKNKNNSSTVETTISFDQSLLKTNSSKEFTDMVLPINKKWTLDDYNDGEIYDTDCCYNIDNGNSYITLWVRIQRSFVTLEKDKEYFDNEADYKNKQSEIFELFDGIDALDTIHTDNNNYSHTVEFIAYSNVYELEFCGDVKLKNDIETLYSNVIGSNLKLHMYETTTEPTTEDYDSDDDYSNDDYDYDYEEETTTKPKKDTLVYSNSKINIYFQDVTTEYDETYVNFKIKNKSSKKLDFQADTITLDGISYNDIVMSDPVAPQSTGIISAQVEKAPYKQPKTVGAELRCFDDNLNTDNISFVNVKVK
jgi:hypothetical protein